MKYQYCLDCHAVVTENLRRCPNNCGENTLTTYQGTGTLYVEWGRQYMAVSDFGIEASYDLLVDACNSQFASPYNHLVFKAGYATGNIFTRIQLGVVRKEFDFKVVFVYNGYEMPINEYGTATNWVEGFVGYTGHLSSLLFEEAMKLRREAKKKEKHILGHGVTNAFYTFFYYGVNDFAMNDLEFMDMVKHRRPKFKMNNAMFRMYYNKKEGFYYKYVGDIT